MAIIAEYLFDEAASGSAAANLLDASGNGNNLPISYNTDDIVYSSDAAGRGWQLAGALDSSPAGAFEDAQDCGFDVLEASTGFGLIIKVTDLDDPTDSGNYDGSIFFQIGIPGSTSFIRLQYNDQGVWQFFWKEVEGYFYGSDVIGIDVDTTQGTAANRIIRYADGSPAAFAEPVTITQNDALTGAGGSTVDVAVGNSVNANKNPTNAFIKYLAISDTPFGSTVQASVASALAANDDTAQFYTPPTSGSLLLHMMSY